MIVRPKPQSVMERVLRHIPYQPHQVGGFERSPHWIVLPRRAFEGHKEIIERLPIIEQEFCDHPLNAIEYVDLPGLAKASKITSKQPLASASSGQPIPRRLGIVASGISYAYLKDALSMLIDETKSGGKHGIGTFAAIEELRILRIATPFPFPDQRATEFMADLDEILVFEELEPVVERELLRVCGRNHLSAAIKGKLTKDTTVAGENTVNSLLQQLSVFLGMEDSAQKLPATISPESTAPEPHQTRCSDGFSPRYSPHQAPPRVRMYSAVYRFTWPTRQWI